MKILIISCIAALALGELVGCSCDKTDTSSSTQSSSMQTDTKDMHHR